MKVTREERIRVVSLSDGKRPAGKKVVLGSNY